MEIASGIRRLGKGLVNAYLVEEAGAVTIIDAGVPGYYGELPAELAAMGRSLGDVKALVLTHGHSDHIGFAERLRKERNVPVSVHEADAALARGEVPNPAKGLGPTRIRPLIEFLWYTMRKGGLRIPRLVEVSTFGDGATLDVPGAPQVILVPGHTPGSAALHVAEPERPVHRGCPRDLRRDDRRVRAAGRPVHRRPRAGRRVARPARGHRGDARPARPRPALDRRGGRGRAARPRVRRRRPAMTLGSGPRQPSRRSRSQRNFTTSWKPSPPSWSLNWYSWISFGPPYRLNAA